jgi:hypothetical protein
VLAAVQVVDSRRGRGRAITGLSQLDGVLLLRRRPLVVHTLGRIAVDVAFCDRELQVVATARLGRYRVARPRLGAGSVIVARGGAFERWGLAPGDQIEVKGG